MDYRIRLGQNGEDYAVDFLTKKGFAIIERNYRYRNSGEIDIIARKDNLLIFVEVKKRRTAQYGGALYSLSSRKKKSMRFVAEQYLNNHPALNIKEITCRFDMVALEDQKINWIEDIFRK